MSGRVLIAVLCGVLLSGSAWADEKEAPAVKRISLEDVPGLKAQGRFGTAVEITDAETATKLFGKEFTTKLKKEVDFAKQKLVYFAWQGSGEDKVNFGAKKGDKPEVVFSYVPGSTRDLVGHTRLFVLPRDAVVKIGR